MTLQSELHAADLDLEGVHSSISRRWRDASTRTGTFIQQNKREAGLTPQFTTA
jgi:hypothetical protein